MSSTNPSNSNLPFSTKILKGKTIVLIVFAVVFFLAFSVTTAQARTLKALEKLEYEIDLESPVFAPRDDPFTIETNNCGSPVAVTGQLQREITFAIEINWQMSEDFSQALTEELGMEFALLPSDKAQAKIESVMAEHIGISNLLAISVEQTASFSREFVTPPDSKATYYFQWEELKYQGRIAIYDTKSQLIGNDIFYVIRDMRLSQIGVNIEPCTVTTVSSPTPYDQPPTKDDTAPMASPVTIPTSLPGFALSQKPVLVSPIYGEYQNPMIFIWRGSVDTSHKVILVHRDKIYRHESDWLQDFTWTFSIPAEEYGNWSWYIMSESEANSDIGYFVFNPVPGPFGTPVVPTPYLTPTSEGLVATSTPEPTTHPEPTTPPYPPPTSYP